MFSIRNQTSMSEDSCFYNSVPAEAVTVAILRCASFHSLFYFMNRKKNLLHKQCFYRNTMQRHNCSKCSLSALTQAHNRFVSRLRRLVDNTLFDVSPLIWCSDVSIRYCCYGNHAAGSKPI